MRWDEMRWDEMRSIEDGNLENNELNSFIPSPFLFFLFLVTQPYSWTKAGVNLLAIEAPMGVGFSYCSSQLEEGKACVNSDTSTAQVSRAALVDFFTIKFPELATGPFYIAGTYSTILEKEKDDIWWDEMRGDEMRCTQDDRIVVTIDTTSVLFCWSIHPFPLYLLYRIAYRVFCCCFLPIKICLFFLFRESAS